MLPHRLKIGLAFGILLLCSNNTFATTADTLAQIWRDGPVSCYSCIGVDDCAAFSLPIRKCENNDAQTCVTVFDDSGAVAQRGCSDTIKSSNFASYCAKNPDSCPSCASVACNDATARSQFVQCLSCDSVTDPDCVLKPTAIKTNTLCQDGCMTALYKSGSVDSGNYHLVRSCLRDRDLDERNECVAGSDSKCIACQGVNCNVAQLPAKQLSCLHCTSSAECEEAKSKQCLVYNEEDQCYVQFDRDSRDVIGMGCRSEFENSTAVIELIKQKSFYLCNGENCNDFEKFPQPNDCIQCNSRSAIECAIKPTAPSKRTKCLNVPYTQCYQRVETDGATTRGCLSDLEEQDFYNCLTNADANCKICTGAGCNQQIIPSDRVQCHRCNSLTDSSCHTRPSELSVCPIYQPNDACVSVYENGVTKRGCLSELPCDANSKLCQQCRGDGCNTENIQKRAEEIYGIFQQLPLNCNTCKGEECLTGEWRPRKCEDDPLQDCMTVFNDNGVVVRRGCEDEVLNEYSSECEKHPELCFNCKSNTCNSITEPTDYQECIYCDSAVNPDCLNNTSMVTTKRKCTEGCLTSLYASRRNAKVQDLVRTCFEDVEMDDRDSCTTANNCVKCTGTKCNTKLLPESVERLSCYYCEGANCAEPVSQLCPGYTAGDQCYMHFDNVTHIVKRMGCRSDLTTAEILADVKEYFICDGDNCNTFENLQPARICYVCNSKTDINCAVDVTKVTTKSRCPHFPYTECYTRILEDGSTERGCQYNLPNEKFIECNTGKDLNCQVCSESDCNSAAYPLARQRCLRCNSLTSDKCEASPTPAQPCPTYVPNDSCTSKIENGITYRGCGSEFNCTGLDRKSCRSCNGYNCNTANLIAQDIGDPGQFQALPLNCYHCNDLESCAASMGKINKCEGNDKQTCTVAFSSSGKVLQRGCSDLLEDVCSVDDNTCYDCKSNGCNVASGESDYVDCIYCDASKGDDCTFAVKEIKRTRKCNRSCITKLYPRTSDANPVYELLRTCLDDLDLDDREDCINGKDGNCKACEGSGCNTALVGSRKSCYQCTGDECQVPVKKTCRAYQEGDQCFVEYDETGSIVELGCKSKYDAPQVNTLLRAKRLWLCNEDNCNQLDSLPTAQRCALCNSLTDPKCAIAPESILSTTACQKMPYTECYTRLLQNGLTERGCLSSLEGEQFVNCLNDSNNSTCVTCVGENCNKQVYPPNRLTCNTCNSATSSNCEVNPQTAQFCLKYSANDKCVSKLTTDGTTVRGCSADVSCTDGIKCETCEGANCNNINIKRTADGKAGMWQTLPLTCHACDDEQDCSTTTRSTVCSGDEYCMTVFNEENVVKQRGCSAAVERQQVDYCNANSDKCHNCNSNNCNSATSPSDYIDCIYCDSSTQPDCASKVTAVTNRRQCHKACMTAMHLRANSVIYDTIRSCLDDLEEADQIACENGSNPNCKACKEANCNTMMLPEDRLSCWTCVGENCDDPVTEECQNYKPNDQCFLLFNSINDVAQMGCLSDLSDEVIEENKHLFILCDEGDNCNSFEKIPAPNSCTVCDSTAGEACATSPNTVLDVARCAALPNTQCFVRVNRGFTERGCINDLPKAQLISCLYGNSTDCFTCVGERCNNEIFPADRRRCQRCNSLDDPNCAALPNSPAICPYYTSNEYCSTKLVNGETYRGCSSDFSCDASNKNLCRLCYNSDNCNVVNLAKKQDDNYGKWQDLPLKCWTCSGKDCKDDSSTVSQQCEDDNEQDCMTVFNETGDIIRRGCSNAVLEEHGNYCDVNEDSCFSCKSNDCNTASSASVFVDCVYCDSHKDQDCVWNPLSNKHTTRKCQGGCMTALYPVDSSNSSSLALTRSCLNDKEAVDQSSCINGDDWSCQACTDTNCNIDSLPDDRLSCFACQGESCEDPTSLACPLYKKDDQCYIWIDNDNSVAEMGCTSSLGDSVTDIIKLKKLLVCDGKNCNSMESLPTPKYCSVCNSAVDARCATNPNLVANAKHCMSLPYTNCVTRIDSTGHTIRDCLASLEADDFYGCLKGSDGMCEVCSGDNCNEIDVYPPNRPECYQCNSRDDPSCSGSPKNSKVCPIYAKNDTCVVTLRNGVTERGCGTTLKCDNPNDSSTCRICDSYACNDANLEKVNSEGQPGKWQGLPLTCRHCKGKAECTEGSVFRKCENNPLQNCMTVFDELGAVVERGCSEIVEGNNLDYCEKNDGKCPKCNSNGCNIAKSLNEYISCLACDTDIDGNCVTSVESITRTRMCYKQCMTALYPRENESNPAYNLARSCLDDMDLDDRDACVAGKKENCQACASANCNKAAIPAKRLSCYVCSGDDCQDPPKQTCTAYRPDDRCYTRYDETRSIIAKGCRSEFSNSEADHLFQQQRMLYCDGDNCNSFDSLPTAQTCALCNSLTDINCAIKPSAVRSSTTCNKMPNTGCYTRVLPSRETERGCVSSLNGDEFASCRNGTSNTCHHCTGNNCNKEVYPANRLSCHICDSTSDPNCRSKPNSLSICPKYAAQDTCATTYVNDVTTRGCSSSLMCDASNPLACAQCAGDGCNTINLARKQDDNFGKWQDLPLKCWTCSGEGCKTDSTLVSERCENNNEQDCVVVFNETGDVIRRGCSDAVFKDFDDYCDENEENCFSCKSNDCNTASSTSVFVDCVYCDSHKNENCVWNSRSDEHKTRKCQGGCMTALYPADSSNSSSWALTRTCLSDKEAADQNNCINGKDENCQACTGPKCNVGDLPADRLTCHTCQGNNCEAPVSLQCPLYKKDDMCYVWFDSVNSVVEMGCVSSFRNQDLESIVKTKRIYVCEGKDCNDMDKVPRAQKCTVCDSKENPLCATNAYEVDTFKTCNQLPNTQCYNELRSDGSTVRGCVYDLQGNDFVDCLLGRTEKCAVCQGDACNREIFPANRQLCYTCTSEDDKNCESYPENALACAVVSDSETCVTALSLNTTVRGCRSDVYCDFYDKETCRSCLGTKCNAIDLRNKVDDGYHGVWQELPLKCFTCNGTLCHSSLGAAVTCAGNNAQDCMTVFDADGEVERRGCSDDVEDYADRYCRENPSHCFRCKSNECNIAWELSDYIECAYCNSTTDLMCAINPENSGFGSRPCYKHCMVAMKEDVVIRSCLDDKELYQQHLCSGDQSDASCAACDEPHCNKFVYPADRLKCHVCSGSDCSNSHGQYCHPYDKNDFCFARYENGVPDLLGCASSQNDSDIADWEAQNRLYRCTDNECNALAKLPLPVECAVCDSSKTPECAQNPTQVSVTEKCQGLRSGCFTKVNQAGYTERGCLSSITENEAEICLNAKTCEICKDDKCNVQIFPANRRRCYICNSTANKECLKTGVNPLICPKYDVGDRCVAFNTNGLVQRGCSSDLSCSADDAKNCQICDSDSCNTADYSAADFVTGSFSLALLLASIAIFFTQ